MSRADRWSRRALLRRAGLVTAGGAAAGLGVNALAPVLLGPAWAIDANASYWARELPPAEPALPAGTHNVDVAIVGGGLTGLSTAAYLCERTPGMRVALLEAHSCGNGASARNGAMLLPSTADRYLVPGANPALDRRLYNLTVDNYAVLQALAATHGIDVQIDRVGALHVVNSAAAARQVAADSARLRDGGISVEFWNREQTAEAIGTTAYAGAQFVPAAGQLHPGRLVALWKRAAQSAGALIYEDTPVLDIDEGATHRITTAAGAQLRAPVVVLATNAYTARLGYLERAAAPVWDYVGITAPLSTERIRALGWSSRAPFDDDHTETCYFGLTRDGRVHVGGGPVDYGFNGGPPDAVLTGARVAQLQRLLAQRYPSLAGVPFEQAWCGAVDMSLDASPALGRMGRHGNIYYAIGYSGHGLNLSSVFGRILADLIVGAQERWRWFPYLDRLPPYIPHEPFRWLGIRARLAFIRATES